MSYSFRHLATLLYADWLPQANGPPRVLQSGFVDYGFTYTQAAFTDNSNLFVSTFLSRCFPALSILLMYLFLIVSLCSVSVIYAALSSVFSVIIPQMKHTSSLVIAVTAMFRFLPFRINL